MINVGDWVKIRLATIQIFGYVEHIFKNDDLQIRRVYAIDENGNKRIYNPKFNYGLYEVGRVEVLKTEIGTEDLNELINLALDMNDREWFLELTKRMEGIKRNGSERSGRKAKEVSN
ncbi:IDEAL domain-containing protein [Aeribacillus composti]|uniref:IDEAL domain-containing protein n=1 Tax=Anoxybacillus phage A403 TaxID=2099336 RepID=A0A2P1JTY7_9CAUD|nr:hypothetical protein HWB56_gp37 [Anoxybacillus phage A403]AVO22605.1 hypothetical protein [Anoxybacillus phage A403]